MLGKKDLTPEVKKALTTNKELKRALEDFFNCHEATIRYMKRHNDQRLLSVNVLAIICNHLNLTEDQILINT